MEFAIGAVIGVIVAGLLKAGKSKKAQGIQSDAGDGQKRKDTDEVITVILPTINNDK